MKEGPILRHAFVKVGEEMPGGFYDEPFHYESDGVNLHMWWWDTTPEAITGDHK